MIIKKIKLKITLLSTFLVQKSVLLILLEFGLRFRIPLSNICLLFSLKIVVSGTR